MFPAVVEKREKNGIDIVVPDHAVKLTEIGPWTIFLSKEEACVYFRSSASLSTVLRLSKDELLMLAREMEKLRHAEKKSAAGTPRKEEVRSSEGSRDRRRFKRFTRRCEVEFTARGGSYKGIAGDFSINGLFIRTNHPFVPDTVFDFMVHLPDGSVSSLQGKVKRSMKNSPGKVPGIPTKEHKNGMGIELIKKDANYLHFIRSLVTQR